MLVPLNWGGNKWMCHQICGSGKRISQYNFGMNIPSFPACRCSFPFMFLLFGPCEENISMKEKRSRDVFKVPQTFQSPGSFSVLRDPLECHLLFSSCKAFPSPLLPLVGLLSWPFFLCEPSLLILLQLPHWAWHFLSALSGRLEDWVQILLGQQFVSQWSFDFSGQGVIDPCQICGWT